MRDEWFRGKEVLDIGCNAGKLTAGIAARFGCARVVGVDIDERLVSRARLLLAQPPRPPAAAPPPAPVVAQDPPQPPQPAMLSNSDLRALLLGIAAAPAAAAPAVAAPAAAAPAATELSARGVFPHNLSFEHGNFVQDPPAAGQPGSVAASFDTILCLSTSKWVHLNWGDAGLMRLFRRVHAALRPGGRFLLEPQPWSSYRKKASLTPAILGNYHAIQLRPTQFERCLLDEVGFVNCTPLDVDYSGGQSDGFKRRPLWLLTK